MSLSWVISSTYTLVSLLWSWGDACHVPWHGQVNMLRMFHIVEVLPESGTEICGTRSGSQRQSTTYVVDEVRGGSWDMPYLDTMVPPLPPDVEIPTTSVKEQHLCISGLAPHWPQRDSNPPDSICGLSSLYWWCHQALYQRIPMHGVRRASTSPDDCRDGHNPTMHLCHRHLMPSRIYRPPATFNALVLSLV